MKNIILTRRNLLLGIIFICSMSLFLNFYPSGIVFAVDAGKIGARPANPDPSNSRTESIFIINSEPGKEVERSVLLVNNKTETVKFLLYATDSAVSNDGSFTCEQYAEKDDFEGSWIELPGEEFLVPAEASKEVKFKVNIPDDLEPGEYNGCLAAEEADKEVEVVNGISINTRVGIRLVVTVPGDIKKELKLVDFKFKIETSNGKLFLVTEVENAGNVSLDTDVQTETKFFGLVSYTKNGGVFPILRDSNSTFNFEFPKPFYGGIFNANLSVTYDASPNTKLGESFQSPVTLRRTFWFVMLPEWWVVVMFILVVVFIVLIVRQFRKRIDRVHNSKNEPQEYI